jgi:hypothetical protein
MWRNRLVPPALLGGLCLFLAPASAQEVPRVNVKEQIDQAFTEVLRNPGSLQSGRSYASVLVESGNFEGAIAALERLLLDPAADPSIRVELGVLYYRVGSYEMAETYLQSALSDPRLVGQARSDAERLLDDVKRRNAPGGRLNGTIALGMRGQTNPTAATSADSLSFGGNRVEIPERSRRNSDIDAFLSASAVHEKDLLTQNSATLVTTGSLFANRYSSAAHYDSQNPKTDPQDLAVLNATTGVRFKPSPADLPDLTLKPYVGVGEMLLDGNQYMAAAGGGLDLAYSLNGGATLLGATYDIRRNFYDERGDIADSGAQSGYEQYLYFSAVQEIAPRQIASLGLTLRDHQAGREYFTYQSIEGRLSYGVGYDNPLNQSGKPWYTSVYGGPSLRDYDGADPQVDPGKTREDVEWRVGASQLFPVAERLALLLVLEYTTSDSNLPNYNYNNVMGSMSFVLNF